MYQLEKHEMKQIAPLFGGWDETLLWSCLQGYMGSAWTDEMPNPKSAQIVTGDFCFFAGIPNAELVKNIPADFTPQFLIMVPHDGLWTDMIEREYPGRCEKFTRYAIKKEPGVFDKEKLRSYISSLPCEYQIRKINEEIYREVFSNSWSEDLCSQFRTYPEYEKFGLGYAVYHQDELVCGASSYTVYDRGIEIEIDTKREYRRKGLALACAARLILDCMDRGLYPSWDAANKASVALAEKLGYHFDKEYTAYAIPVFK